MSIAALPTLKVVVTASMVLTWRFSSSLRNRAVFSWAIPLNAAPKTDIVFFKNGNELTGEIKSLRRGRLSTNTDATGTIAIEWEKISGIVSNQNIQVETANGIRHFRHLTISEKDSEIIVVTADGSQSLDPARVIIMEPIEGGGIHDEF